MSEEANSVVSEMPRTKENFKKLLRDVDWQRGSFLSYCLKIVWPSNQNIPPDHPSEILVRELMDHYFLLALLFYRQMREDLRKKYLATPSTLKVDEVKINMQLGLDKLIEEWGRVYAVILSIRANQVSKKAGEILQNMELILPAAKKDVYLPSDFLAILQIEQAYSMRFFNYVEGMAALNMPLASYSSPWEWTILWHELAGEKVRALKNDNRDFFVSGFSFIIEQLDETERAKAENLGWSVDWFEELFEDSFLVANFPIHFLYVFKNLFERYADVSGKGTRHPSFLIRLAVAMFFHLQKKGFEELPDSETWISSDWWKNNWPEIDITQMDENPERFAEFNPALLLAKHPDSDTLNLKVTQLVAKHILLWHKQQTKQADDNSKKTHDLIDNAIKKYSRGLNFLDIKWDVRDNLSGLGGSSQGGWQYSDTMRMNQNDLEQVENIILENSISETGKIIDDLTSENLNIWELLDALELKNRKIWRLLRNGDSETSEKLGYKDLLVIPFNDVDFNTEMIMDIKLNGKAGPANFQFSGVWNVTIDPAYNPKGEVVFKKANTPLSTSKLHWNQKFKGTNHRL